MKSTIPYLRLGESIEGRVVEAVAGRELIVSFRGDLLRVQNETRFVFVPGDKINLLVTAVSPLRFQIFRSRARSHGLDVVS